MREIKFRAWDSIGAWMVGDHTVKDRLNSFPKTWGLMQYTGLKDKNGVEIFEGDIVRIEHGETTKNVRVIFISGSFDINDPNCCEHCANGVSCWGSLYEAVAMRDSVEVIGNVYENPELLRP